MEVLVKVPDGAVDLQECLLHRILGLSHVACDQESRAHRSYLVQTHKYFQSANVTRFQSQDSFPFVHYPPGIK